MSSILGSKPKRGPSPEQIRKEEEERQRKESLERLRADEERRSTLRRRASELEEEGEGQISRKRLFGE